MCFNLVPALQPHTHAAATSSSAPPLSGVSQTIGSVTVRPTVRIAPTNLTLVVRVSNRVKLRVQLEQLGLLSHLECWSHTAGYLLSLLLLPERRPEAFSRCPPMGG